MKSLIFTVSIVSLSLISCKKEYACDCKSIVFNPTQVVSQDTKPNFKARNWDKAMEVCNKHNSKTQFAQYHCETRVVK